ncbi:hypothetical protein ACHAWF_013416 [Thalassiosira exigua]
MIISPQAILNSSDIFASWQQIGFKEGIPGLLRFSSHDGLLTMSIRLDHVDGLYYCPTDAFTVDTESTVRPLRPRARRAKGRTAKHLARPPSPPPVAKQGNHPRRRKPTSRQKQLDAELWAARLGHCGERQLELLPGNADGIPASFEPHPFRIIDWKEQACTRKKAAGRTAERTADRGKRFYMDFGFMRASQMDYGKRTTKKDRVVTSYDGYNSYLVIVDEASSHAWIFLFKSKEPPLETLDAFMTAFRRPDGGFIRTDQGGELAGCDAFVDQMLSNHGYKVEPTGADSPSQNGGAERWNDTFAVSVRALLYGSGMPAKYWSAALLHACYLHNRRVHQRTKKTPFEAWNGQHPDLTHLKLFGSRVCVKQTGDRRAKLDRHDFAGIFLGYTATDQNIRYLDLDSGLVKTCHHASFDEAWYLQPVRPPAAQMLYDLGLEAEAPDFPLDEPVALPAPYPPLPKLVVEGVETERYDVPPLAKVLMLPLRLTEMPTIAHPLAAAAARVSLFDRHVPTPTREAASLILDEFAIGREATEQVYISPSPYADAFEEFNNRWELPEESDLVTRRARYDVVESGDVLNYVTRAMRLTRGRLLRQDDWKDWQNSEYLQLDQYDKQGMFGDPVTVESKEAVFHLVWSYAVKAADGQKKARMTCDGSTHSGQVRVLDHTYTNCVDQTSSRLFYAISAAENLLIYGSDVSNAFGEAAPPKQGFYIRPDKAFHEWWVNHKGRAPIPHGHVIPVLAAMQGHPEAPRLWEKHADAILREVGLTPTTHEPCLYSGLIDGKRVIFKRQVNDFAAACPDQHTADLLFDMIDERLSIPLKRQGLIDMFNGMDVAQTRDYVKLYCKTYIERICEKHLAGWMKHVPVAEDRPIPMKTKPNYLKRLFSAVGSTDPKQHALLA